MSAKTTYKAGADSTVAWCVSATTAASHRQSSRRRGPVSAVTTPGTSPPSPITRPRQRCRRHRDGHLEHVRPGLRCDTYAAAGAVADKGAPPSPPPPSARRAIAAAARTPPPTPPPNFGEVQTRRPSAAPAEASSHHRSSRRWDTYENNEGLVGARTPRSRATPATLRPSRPGRRRA